MVLMVNLGKTLVTWDVLVVNGMRQSLQFFLKGA